MAQSNYLNDIGATGLLEATYGEEDSFQLLAADLTLTAEAGSSDSVKYLAAVMGNAISAAALTKTQNIIAGVIGKHDITGAISSTYPTAGVWGEIGDKSVATAAVMAVMGGDSGENTNPRALIGVDWQNSTEGTRVAFGLDLEGVIHDDYKSPRYGSGLIRLGGRFDNAGTVETVNDLLVLAGTAAPTNGTSGTGAAAAAAGSVYIRQSGSNSKIYINGNTKASPTWNVVTSA